MPYKPGGGNKPELYDPNNGQYVSDEEKNAFLENEIGNIVLRTLFGFKNDTYEPRFPIFGFHNETYCYLYVAESVRGSAIYVDDNKISNYLLKHLEKDDKSHFFEMHGYLRNEPNKLKQAIVNGTDSNKAKFNRFKKEGLFIEIQTRIYSYREKVYIRFKTIWRYDEKTKTLKFVTAILKNIERTL